MLGSVEGDGRRKNETDLVLQGNPRPPSDLDLKLASNVQANLRLSSIDAGLFDMLNPGRK